MKISVLLFFLLLSVAGLLLYSAHPAKPAKPDLSLPVADKVLVVKSRRTLTLLKGGKVIKTYKIALGRDPVGDKVREGDNKTPEGHYILDWRNASSSCYKSLHVSYPNKEDRERAKKQKVAPGGSIMIHGLHPSIEWMGTKHISMDWTYGCMAVTNEEMDEIWKSVRNGTAIEIRK